MPNESTNPVAIVTGAAYGIGKTVAIEFAKAGYKLFLVDLDEKNLKKLVTSELKDYPVAYHSGDVSKSSDVQPPTPALDGASRGREELLTREMLLIFPNNHVVARFIGLRKYLPLGALRLYSGQAS